MLFLIFQCLLDEFASDIIGNETRVFDPALLLIFMGEDYRG